MKYSIIAVLLFMLTLSSQKLDAQNRHIKAGDNAFETQLYHVAAEKYRKGLKKIKDQDERKRVFYQMAECYRLTSQLRKARSQYLTLYRMKYYEEKPEILLKLGQIMIMLEDFDKANEYLSIFDTLMIDHPQSKIALESIKFARRTISNPNNYTVTNIKKINTRFDEFSPCYQDINYQSIFFTSNREEAYGKDIDGWTGQEFSDIFFAKIDRKGEWDKPESIDENEVINTKDNEGQPMFNSRFSRMYFTRCVTDEDKPSGCLILFSKRSGMSWDAPEVLDLGSDTSDVVGHPAISPDEKKIIFAANFDRGAGGKDLYIATRDSKLDPFDRPRNLGPLVNTSKDEMFPFFRDDTTVYFSSNGHIRLGGLDIYKVILKGDTIFSQPENMGYPINSPADDFGIIFDPNQHEAGYFSSTRPKGKGGADIYSFYLPPLEYTISGVVTDNYTFQIIPDLEVIMKGSDGSEKKAKTLENGKFSFNKNQVNPDTEYELIFENEGYFRKVLKETTVGLNHSKDIEMEVTLDRIPDEPIVLPEILFDLAKWDLKPQFEDSLQGLIETMDANPQIIVELGAHTDARGNDENNDILSQKRAESVVDYLILRGIDPGRLFAKGYGESVPRTLYKEMKKNGITFPEGVTLTEEYIDSLPNNQKETAHSLNRRIEFRIVGKEYQARALAEQGDTSDVRIQLGDKKNRIFFSMPSPQLYQTDCMINGYNAEVIYTPVTNLVTCSMEYALELLQKGIIKKEDFKGNPDDIISTGNIAHKSVFTIKDFRLGNKTIRNVDVYVWQGSTYKLIINTVTLQKFGNPTIDENMQTITFE